MKEKGKEGLNKRNKSKKEKIKEREKSPSTLNKRPRNVSEEVLKEERNLIPSKSSFWYHFHRPHTETSLSRMMQQCLCTRMVFSIVHFQFSGNVFCFFISLFVISKLCESCDARNVLVFLSYTNQVIMYVVNLMRIKKRIISFLL